jgi:hypothetical protein
MENYQSHRCLDVGADNYTPRTLTCDDGTNYQDWSEANVDDTWVQVQNIGTDRDLVCYFSMIFLCSTTTPYNGTGILSHYTWQIIDIDAR